MHDLPVLPEDPHDQRLVSHVHPAGWQNPTPSGRYNLVVIGAGAAGLITAAGAAGLGARVALIERSLMGGDCLNVGCVPSKALIRAARAAHDARTAGRFGVHTGDVTVDFAAVMDRLRSVRADIAPVDSAARFTELGVDVYLGQGRFTGPDTVQVDGQQLQFSKAVIATGGRATAPPIPGLADAGYLDNSSIFNLTERPARLAVIGGGPIGCEMAQSFQRLGSQVTLLEMADHVLPREDPDGAAIVQASMAADGVDLRCGARISAVRRDGDETVITVDGQELRFDRLLVAAGRRPNIEDLGLDTIGVATTRRGVTVDECLQTTNRDVFAVGDVAFKFQFTHAADACARIVIQNALFPGGKKTTALTIPWATYTDPELAHVGLTAAEAAAQGVEIQTFTQHFDDVDRAILEGETQGFARVHVAAGSDKIVGATIVGRHAGDFISELTLAKTHGLGMKAIASTIHPYPTTADAIRRLGDAYNRTRLTSTVKGAMGAWMKLRR